MGLLPDTQNCGCACAGNAGNVFPVTAGKRSRHASRHVRHARAVMHAGIANYRFPLKSAAGENVPGIPGACATCNFTYLVRGPWDEIQFSLFQATKWITVFRIVGGSGRDVLANWANSGLVNDTSCVDRNANCKSALVNQWANVKQVSFIRTLRGAMSKGVLLCKHVVHVHWWE